MAKSQQLRPKSVARQSQTDAPAWSREIAMIGTYAPDDAEVAQRLRTWTQDARRIDPGDSRTMVTRTF